MPNEPLPISVEPTPLFKRELRTLAKSYRKVRSDIEPLIAQLQAGELPGDRVPGIKYTVFKVRLKNSSVQKGKSGGYRIIYYLRTKDRIILVTIYSKSDRADVSNKVIEDAIAQYERQQQQTDNEP